MVVSKTTRVDKLKIVQGPQTIFILLGGQWSYGYFIRPKILPPPSR